MAPGFGTVITNIHITATIEFGVKEARGFRGRRRCYNTAKIASHIEVVRKVMKKKLVLLFAALFCLSGMLVPAVKAVEISIGGYDRPYYVHGPGYWNGRVYYGWAPGYWGWRHHHRYWRHGYYRVRR